jgi:hypothetical protein
MNAPKRQVCAHILLVELADDACGDAQQHGVHQDLLAGQPKLRQEDAAVGRDGPRNDRWHRHLERPRRTFK